MKCNVGKTDKIIRIILLIASLILGYFISAWFYILSIILILTVIFSYCPLYLIFNVNTCK